MNAGQRHDVVVLIATKDRRGFLFERALPSVLRQTLPPSRIVVVDDSSDEGSTEKIAQLSGLLGVPIELLHNRRTPGASGAWNSGLDHLARAYADPGSVFIAVLDDDDEWEPRHLEVCYERASATGANVVASAFLRIENGAAQRRTVPSPRIDTDEALVKNPGFQGSNVFIRLDVMLEAGCFDEALASCTDRDLCLRLVALPHLRSAVVEETTVRHYACTSRARLSTRGSAARQAGLDAFWLKHSPLMTASQLDAFEERAVRLFDWTRPAPPTSVRHNVDEVATPEGCIALLVAFIADTERIESVDALLGDLKTLRGEPGLAGLDVLVLENGETVDGSMELERVVEAHRRAGLRVQFVSRPRHGADARNELVIDGGASAGLRLAIGPARTVLQSYAYALASARPGIVVWILDDDMRLDPLVDDGETRRRRHIPLVPQVLRLREAGVDVAIGAYTGAAPLPFAATIRVQLVDLLASLQWFKTLSPTDRLPDMTARNRALEAGRRDFYYDLSRRETDRLETSFLFESEDGLSVGEAFEMVSSQAERILAGEQISRPLTVPAAWSAAGLTDQLKRGGNTFIFDVEALRDVPNLAPDVDGRATRRSDMIWSLLQRVRCSRKIVTAPVGVFHDRSRIVPGTLDVEKTVDDIRGFAIYSALEEGALAGEDRLLRGAKFVEERLAAFRLSFHRCRGAAAAIRAALATGWITDPRFSAARARLVAFCDRIDGCYTQRALREIEEGARRLRPEAFLAFHAEIGAAMAAHRERLTNAAPHLVAGFGEQRLQNAIGVVERMATPAAAIRVLGSGAEGVALTDGARVYKVFDHWKARDPDEQRAFLRSLVGRFASCRHLYPIEAFRESGYDAVLIYPFEESAPYTGGRGPSLVELLAECHAERIVCRNLHPDNLRVVDGRVRLIDYGSDIRALNDDSDGFEQMCRRVFLSWRFAHRADLKELMRRALVERELPHLDGFERFYEAVRLRAGVSTRGEPLRGRAMQLAGGAVLDYGCGRGVLLRALAPTSESAVGFDPDACLREEWSDLVDAGAPMTNDASLAIAEGPFDLVVCERVICTLDDDNTVMKVADDLRAAVKPDGRVLISVCHPGYAWRAPTPESIPDAPPDAHSEHRFSWTKTVCCSGRRRQEMHRPERTLTGLLGRAGLRVVARFEASTVDTERFEYAADVLVFELAPVARSSEVTLLVKACAMDVETIDAQVRHIVAQLDEDGRFRERVLALDSRVDGFARLHAAGDIDRLRSIAERLRSRGLVDRVIAGPVGDAAARVNRVWFGAESRATHASNGAQVASTLAAFDACSTRYVLQVDADAMILRERGHDYLREMLDALQADEHAVTVAFNVAQENDRPYTSSGPTGPWRTEVRCCLLDLERLRRLLPLENDVLDGVLKLPWHRALDASIRSGRATSLRGGAKATFFVHPQNERKEREVDAWALTIAQLERGRVAAVQRGEVEWRGNASEWVTPERGEPFVFVILGRNVQPGRFRRCVESVARQTRNDWGAVVVDDGSEPAVGAEMARVTHDVLGARASFLRLPWRRGGMANLLLAVRDVCEDPESVIVTLDADDALLGSNVLDRVGAEYARGADVTIGSMLRTDKAARYPVLVDDPRSNRGGNVWQHLRTFKKRLFEAVPVEDLRVDGAFVDVAHDWAFMLPMVELAKHVGVIEDELYLYEPSGEGKGLDREGREATIAAIVAKPTRRKAR